MEGQVHSLRTAADITLNAPLLDGRFAYTYRKSSPSAFVSNPVIPEILSFARQAVCS